MTFTEQLRDLEACPEAIEWVNNRSLCKCWQVVDRADWMLWLAAKVGVDRKPLVLAACDCAEPALKYVPDGEERPRKAIETARAWCKGKATLKQVRSAAADAAVYAADADAAYTAAAYASSYAADSAVYASDADAAAAYAAYAAAARQKAHKSMCRIIRKRIPVEMIEERL